MFVVYGREDCKYCRKAKKALELVKEPFEYVPLEDKDVVREELRLQGFATIPAIFLNGEVIGGYDELHEWVTEKYLS